MGFTSLTALPLTRKQQEKIMTNTGARLLRLAIFVTALIAAAPIGPALAAGGGGGGGGGGDSTYGAPPASDSKPTSSKATHKTKKKSSKQSDLGEPAFSSGYRAAYASIYERQDYAGAIEQLKALGANDRPNVANLIGYSYRKLGDYKLSQGWYERALKADPKHVLTWQYYGLCRSNKATGIKPNTI